MKEWILDPDTHRLCCGETNVQITPKASAVLESLLSRSGEVVTRDELIDLVWPDLHVTPDLVREYIHDLRVALNDDAQKPKYIKTVRGRGFQLLGGVRKVSEPVSPDMPSREVRATIGILKPLVGLASEDLTEFAEDIAADVINELARYRDIAVVARVSSFVVDLALSGSEIARTLGADYLLESSFARTGDAIRARFQLVEGQSGHAVWSNKIELSANDLLAGRDRIVGSVVTTLVGWNGAVHVAQYKQVSVREPNNLTAFEHFIRGCDINLVLDEPGLMRSIAHLRWSLELDPRFARCWAMKSVMLRWAYDVVAEPSPQLLVEAGNAIEQAFLLDPNDPANLALAAVKWAGDGDFARAEDATRRSEEMAWWDADACMAATTPMALILGDMKAAARLLERARELNPAIPGYHKIVETRIAFFIGEFERSITASRRGFEHVSSIAFRALSEAMLGDASAARQSLLEVSVRFPRFNFEDYARRFPVRHPAARAVFETALGRLCEVAGPLIESAALKPAR